MVECTLSDAIQLLRRGRTTRARAILEKVLEIHPKNLLALSYLGVVDVLLDQDDIEAEERCFRAAITAPENAQLHANLAWVLYMKGKRRSAAESVREALSRDSENEDALRIERRLGRRRTPPISILARSNPLNIVLGRFVHRLTTA